MLIASKLRTLRGEPATPCLTLLSAEACWHASPPSTPVAPSTWAATSASSLRMAAFRACRRTRFLLPRERSPAHLRRCGGQYASGERIGSGDAEAPYLPPAGLSDRELGAGAQLCRSVDRSAATPACSVSRHPCRR